MFLTVNQKLPIRKTLLRVLGGLDGRQIQNCVAAHLQSFVESISETEGHRAYNDVCNGILSCTENFPPGLRAVTSVAGDVFNFTVDFLKQLVQFVM